MRSVGTLNAPKNNATKKMFNILIVTCLPLLAAFVLYLSAPDSQLLSSIATAASDLPTLFSANNSLLSSVMSAYCKTAPFWALLFFLVSYNDLQLNTNQPARALVTTLVLFSILYFAMMYLFLLHTAELTEAGRLVRFMAENDYLLTLFFICIYAVCYVLTAYYLSFVYAVYKSFRK